MIELDHVTYTYWNRTEPTLHDISVRIEGGSLSILVGPSGSGKSTFCAVMNGIIPHLSGGKLEGQILVDGRNTRDLEVKDLALTVGQVFQDPETMFATLSVEDELAFGPENLRFPPLQIRERVEELLNETGLTDHRKDVVWDLSGGQLQKLGLACVLAMGPQVIVLDEPTANLDPAATSSVHELVLNLCAKGVTVLLVTREADELLAQADQLIVLNDGHLVDAGPPRDVLRRHGRFMLEELGIWLPETVEIGIQLNVAGKLGDSAIPITVSETVAVIQHVAKPDGPKVEVAPPRTEVCSRVASTTPLILAHQIGYTYPNGTHALDSVSLSVQAGEWVMILGRNGAGKSTLARMLVGLLKPQSGTLTLFGEDAHKWNVEKLAAHISLVFQNPEHQFLTDTVRDEIGYSLLSQGITSSAEIEGRTDAALEMLGLQEVGEVHPFALSAGLKRRLGVATMLVGNPRVLVVDEPTYGQDKNMTRTLMSRMQEIRSRGVSVIMITHDMRLVQEYGERAIVMSEGSLLYDGPSTSLFDRGEVLDQAHLRRTMLHKVIAEMGRRGFTPRGAIRQTSDLIRLLDVHC